MQPRQYQTDISNRAADIVRQHGLVYLAMQVRTGKTDNYILITSDEEIKEDCYAVHFSPLGEIELVTANGVCKLDKKVIAHLPLNNSSILEGVPLLPPLPDEDDEIIENLENYLLKVNQLYKDWLGIGFKGGYHKAKEKYKFTEKDMIKVIDYCKHNRAFEYDFEKVMESLSQPKLPVGFKCEMEEIAIGGFIEGVDEAVTVDKKIEPKIINGVMQGEWIFE